MTGRIIKILSLVLLVSCGKPPGHGSFSGTTYSGTGDAGDGTDTNPDGTKNNTIDPLAKIPLAASLTSFEENVYKPVLSSDCSSCHATTFAPRPKSATQSTDAEGKAVTTVEVPTNIEDAHKAFLNIVNFNSFSGVDLTRPVAKLSGGHNCARASDKECAKVMTAAIGAWLADLEKAGYQPVAAVYPNSTASVDFSSAVDYPMETDGTLEVIGKADQAKLTAPWTLVKDDPDGSLATYVQSDPKATAAKTPVAAQSATFSLDTKADGEYELWLRVRAKTAANTRIAVQVNQLQMIPLALPVTDAEWKWVKLHQIVNKVDTDTKLKDLKTGKQDVKIWFQDPAVQISGIVLTKKFTDFNGDLFSTKYSAVKVPLAVEGVPDASIVAVIWDNGPAGDHKSVGLKHLEIQSSSPIAVKKIKPLFNGIFSSNQGTYDSVDAVAGGPDASKRIITTKGSTASVWIVDRTKDKLSFSFESITKAP